MHVFGHVHGANGITYLKGCDTTFVNTATKCNVFDVMFERDDDLHCVDIRSETVNGSEHHARPGPACQ